jgi:methyl-accepting chemotaxis protein
MSGIINRLIAGLSIQSKILVFIAPISILIIAVAAVSVVTGQVIGQQIEGTSHSISTLSEFKYSYTEISVLLSNPSQMQHDLVVKQLKEHSTRFEKAINEQSDAAIAASLRDTKVRVDALLPQVDSLWHHYEAVSGLDAELRNNLDRMIAEKDEIGMIAQSMSDSLRKQDSDAKTDILNADFLSTSSKVIGEAVSRFTAAETPEQTFSAATALAPKLTLVSSRIVDALPESKNEGGQKIRSAIKEILKLARTGNPDEVSALRIKNLMQELSPMAISLRGGAVLATKQATIKFSELAQPLKNAREVGAYVSQVGTAINDLLVQMAAFRVARDQRSLDKAIDAKAALITRLGKLPPMKEMVVIRPHSSILNKIAAKVSTLGSELVEAELGRREAFEATAKNIDQAWLGIVRLADMQRGLAQSASDNAVTTSLTTAAISVVFAIFATLALVGALKGPIKTLTETMKDVANGRIDAEVIGTDRRDEIGEMARALGVFKSNAHDKLRFEAEARENRIHAEEEQQAAYRQREKVALELRETIDMLGANLRRLADGDLTCNINLAFAGELDELRVNFNESVDRMRDAMALICDNSIMIAKKSEVLKSNANDLARRTEQQAASLEETAAAVEQITSAVKMSSQRAGETNRVSDEILQEVNHSADVVANAVIAMSRIETASDQISQIIGAIDEIAFQTNLLALNAGVEAARAGEAGKGFAVVAQEVRELAQRSAKSAREIKQLIGHSGQEVKAGVKLVGESGEAMARINALMQKISLNIADVALASGEQSTGLQEVNSAVNEMDQMTQRNAAMVEETNAASHELAVEATALQKLIRRFKISGTGEGPQQHYHAVA